jgi:hypothetical protein
VTAHTLSVGAPFDPAIPTWPEGAHYSATGQHRLVVFLAHPTDGEVQSLRVGVPRFALLVRGNVIALCYRFAPGIPWGDAPYSVWLEGGKHDLPELPTSQSRYTLAVIGVDASTGLVVSLRSVSLSPQFSANLRHAVTLQLAQPVTRPQYDAELAALCARMTTQRMVEAASVTCKGGGA